MYAYSRVLTFFSILLLLLLLLLSCPFSFRRDSVRPTGSETERRPPTARRRRIGTHAEVWYSLLSAAVVDNVYAHNTHTTTRARVDIILFIFVCVKRHALGVPGFRTVGCRDNTVADGGARLRRKYEKKYPKTS